jgi:hypothetical protein
VDRDDGLQAGVLAVAENDLLMAGLRDGFENHGCSCDAEKTLVHDSHAMAKLCEG